MLTLMGFGMESSCVCGGFMCVVLCLLACSRMYTFLACRAVRCWRRRLLTLVFLVAAGIVASAVAFYPCPKDAVKTAVVFTARDESSLNRIGVFNAFAGVESLSPNRLTVLPDTGADITMISPSAVDPS